MKRVFVLLACLGLLATGCSREMPTAPPTDATIISATSVDPVVAATEILRMAGWDATQADGLAKNGAAGILRNFEREDLGGGIAHYSMRVQTGPGSHDVVGLHRVVLERRPGQPLRTHRNVFLQHGDIKDFTGLFLPGRASPRQADDVGFAAYLARNGIDVWGIDQAWTLVPAEETDLGFMAGWGMQRQIDDLDICVSIARTVRQFTGGGPGQMLLLGYSSGSATGMAYINQESQLPEYRRNIAGFVAADFGLASNDPAFIAAMQGDIAAYEAEVAAGNYAIFNPFTIFGPPALNDPDGPSPYIPGFTNLTAGIAIAVWPAYPDLAYHYLAGMFDGDGLPTGLQYTDVDNWVDFMVYAPPYEPYAFMLDYSYTIVAPETVPFADHFGDISIPILWLEAAGGAAPPTRYALELLTAADITEVRVGFLPPDQAVLDFAHIDLFIAENAPDAAWAPTLDWILAHSPRGAVGRKVGQSS